MSDKPTTETLIVNDTLYLAEDNEIQLFEASSHYVCAKDGREFKRLDLVADERRETGIRRLLSEQDEARGLTKLLVRWCHIHRDDSESDQVAILAARRRAENAIDRWEG